jgi:hypothetical protein
MQLWSEEQLWIWNAYYDWVKKNVPSASPSANSATPTGSIASLDIFVEEFRDKIEGWSSAQIWAAYQEWLREGMSSARPTPNLTPGPMPHPTPSLTVAQWPIFIRIEDTYNRVKNKTKLAWERAKEKQANARPKREWDIFWEKYGSELEGKLSVEIIPIYNQWRKSSIKKYFIIGSIFSIFAASAGNFIGNFIQKRIYVKKWKKYDEDFCAEREAEARAIKERENKIEFDNQTRRQTELEHTWKFSPGQMSGRLPAYLGGVTPEYAASGAERGVIGERTVIDDTQLRKLQYPTRRIGHHEVSAPVTYTVNATVGDRDEDEDEYDEEIRARDERNNRLRREAEVRWAKWRRDMARLTEEPTEKKGEEEEDSREEAPVLTAEEDHTADQWAPHHKRKHKKGRHAKKKKKH